MTKREKIMLEQLERENAELKRTASVHDEMFLSGQLSKLRAENAELTRKLKVSEEICADCTTPAILCPNANEPKGSVRNCAMKNYQRPLPQVEKEPAPKVADTLVIFPAQCSCGHIFLEKYMLPKPNENGEVGFCWCGFCKTRVPVFPLKEPAPKVTDDPKYNASDNRAIGWDKVYKTCCELGFEISFIQKERPDDGVCTFIRSLADRAKQPVPVDAPQLPSVLDGTAHVVEFSKNFLNTALQKLDFLSERGSRCVAVILENRYGNQQKIDRWGRVVIVDEQPAPKVADEVVYTSCKTCRYKADNGSFNITSAVCGNCFNYEMLNHSNYIPERAVTRKGGGDATKN
jgi:hypothetical protein